jgi:hypothetical protein
MSKATILFYKDNLAIFKKVVAILCSRADKICKKQNFDSFSIQDREDTIEEVKNEKNY